MPKHLSGSQSVPSRLKAYGLLVGTRQPPWTFASMWSDTAGAP